MADFSMHKLFYVFISWQKMNHLSEAIKTIKIISSKYFPGNFIIHLDVCCDCGQLLSLVRYTWPQNTPRTVPLHHVGVENSMYINICMIIQNNTFQSIFSALIQRSMKEFLSRTRIKIIIWLIIKCNDRKSNHNNLKVSYCALGMISSNKMGV